MSCSRAEVASEVACGATMPYIAVASRGDMAAAIEHSVKTPLQLCAFDVERDYPEGEEARQILAYYPEECSIDQQTSVVGLTQALLTFVGNFDEVG